MTIARAMGSEYIEWAKLRSQARYNLATSGVMHYPLRDLGVTLGDIEISGPSWYGYEPLLAALAAKCGVPQDCVVAAIGTSQANHLVMAALVAPGDEVLIEHPAYDPLVTLASHLGAQIKRFARRPAGGFAIDAGEVARLVTPRTRLIALTNLHNPSGAFVDDATLRQLGEVAQRVGARVLVDEVYLEMLALEAPPADRTNPGAVNPPLASAAHLGPEFVVTSSLTKAYGLSGLRCGWILAQPELAQRIWRVNDLFCNIPAHPAERLSVLALQRLPQIARRARDLLAANRALLNTFLGSRADLEAFRPATGTVIFPRWKGGHTERLCALLREEYETTVVPGRFFEMPGHFRIGIGGATADLAAGLERLGLALDEFAGKG
jgi:hypothetical protein